MTAEPPSELRFPLVERAERLGVFDGASALILAPTATGKSYIGRRAIDRAVRRAGGRTHAYLVPFRALAQEMYDELQEVLADTGARVRISTGDHRDSIRPHEADVVVATYESFVGLLRMGELRPGVVVADEVHLIADLTRGPLVEGLFARLLASRRARTLLALSAVVDNGAELARWIGVPLIDGSADDRPVELSLSPKYVDDLDEGLQQVIDPCRRGKHALVFCTSRAGAEKTAEVLRKVRAWQTDAGALARLTALAERFRGDGSRDGTRLAALLPAGVAFHHAGLPRDARRALETAFAGGDVRILTCTPTLAAGVNLPADIAVVRDVYRFDVIRGAPRRVPLPSGEVLNMLGRAGRPGMAAKGLGVALVSRQAREDERIQELVAAIEAGRGGRVESRMPESFEGVMRFVLATVVERGEATRDDVVDAYKRTLAYHARPESIAFDRPFRDDMMEDLPNYQKVVASRGKIFLKSYRLSPAGVHAAVQSSDHRYDVTLGVTALTCTCPAASQYYRRDICKHEACAIHEILFGGRVQRENPEAYYRAIYNCGHVFSRTLDTGTRLVLSLEILTAWGMLERVPTGLRATPLGLAAAGTRFDLLLVHEAVERVRQATAAGHLEVATWAVNDFFADEKEHDRWQRAVTAWLAEVDDHKIAFPGDHRGDFERTMDDLGRVCTLYRNIALALEKDGIARGARDAAGAVRYGVAPALVPLMALNLSQLGRARCRRLFDKGVKNVDDLARADVAAIADPRQLPAAYVREWVARAQDIQRARRPATPSDADTDPAFDELVARFRIDPAALQ